MLVNSKSICDIESAMFLILQLNFVCEFYRRVHVHVQKTTSFYAHLTASRTDGFKFA
jgi:hypothetical protein